MTRGPRPADTRPASRGFRSGSSDPSHARPAREVPHLKVFRFAIVAALLLVPAVGTPAGDPPPGPPTLFVPAPNDSADAHEPPAPVLIPGRPYSADTLKRTTAQVVREFFLKGEVLERDGNPQAAMAAYRNVVMLDPTYPDAHFRMGQIYEAFGSTAEAMKAYAAEVEHHPRNTDAARSLGLSLARLGESERALQQLELLVRRNPRDGASWRALGFAYTLAKRFKEAEKALRNAIALPPADAEEYRDLGVLLANQGREREAREAYLQAAKLDPRDATALINLANIDLRAGRPEPALDRYREAEARDTSSVFAYRGQVQALAGLGREAESGDVYRRWMQRVPDDEIGRFEAMQYFAKRGRADIGLEIARDGVRRAPRSGYARQTLGLAYAWSGDDRAALAELRASQRLLRRVDPAASARSGELLAGLRTTAPDSLRAIFVQDSLRFEAPRAPSTPAGADTSDVPPPPAPR